VVCVGETLWDPLASTLVPFSVTSSAFSVLQVSVEDCPGSMVPGFADKVAVTGLGAGGGGGGCGGCFFPQPLLNATKKSAVRMKLRFLLL
jgi:hypothetical protein